MAPVTTAIDAVSFFYPIGNTPAVDFTQELGPDIPARILLLGCGDVRSILYSAYTNSQRDRSLSFSCCDFEGAIIARNVLLLSLILDSSSEQTLTSLWNIYYHFWLTDNDQEILRHQATKLLDLSISSQAWYQGPYAKALKFHDERTMSEVRRVWASYFTSDKSAGSNAGHLKILKQRIEQSKSIHQRLIGDHGVNLTGTRSAAPVAFEAIGDLLEATKHFWEHGTLPVDKAVTMASNEPNPMFASTLTATSALHYGLDPLLGYHLSSAYVKVAEPFSSSGVHTGATGLERLSETALSQFRLWAASYRDAASPIKVEVMVGDAIEFCSSMLVSNMSSHQFEPEPSSSGSSHMFNVIDTSNLADHLGTLNLLIYTAPLLDTHDPSTLYTDILVQHKSELDSTFKDILHGDFTTMSVFLGLWPIEYWTNASFVSPEEATFHSILKSMQGSESDYGGQAYCRILWKPSVSPRIALQADTADLVHVLHTVYRSFFSHEELEASFAKMMAGIKIQKPQLPKYHRGSYAALVAYLKSRVRADWHNVARDLIDVIERDRTMMGQNYLQELYLQFHLHGIFSTSPLLRPKDACASFSTAATSLYGQHDLPSALCVTLQVPMASLKIFTDLMSKPERLGSPLVHGIIKSSSTYADRPWINCFAAVQMCFGKVNCGVEQPTLDQSLTIETDEANWNAKDSSLLASFMVPSWLLLLEPENAIVALALQPNTQSIMLYGDRLGLELTVYGAKQSNKKEVFVSSRPPRLATPVSPGRVQNFLSTAQPLATAWVGAESSVRLAHDPDHCNLNSVTSRWELPPGNALEALRSDAQVSIAQEGPFSIRIIVSKASTTFDHVLGFPLPVMISAASVRIARKSAYIEVSVRTRVLAAGIEQDSLLTAFPRYAATLANVPRLNSNLQPTLDLKQDFQWLTPHITFQMSDAERNLRERYFKTSIDCPSTRVNFKDSIFSMFMHYTGVQGGKADIFGLSIPDGGIHILVLVSAFKLDLGNHTVFLDAAVIPLTPSKLRPLTNFIGAITERGVRQITVNLEELRLWHGMLAMYVERCRTWKHKPSCEWQSAKWKQQQWHQEHDPLCSCGQGLGFSDQYLSLPQWDTAKRFALRAAISPLYFVPYVDKVYKGMKGSTTERCAFCSREGSGVKLLACGKCRTVRYCSKDCQKSDWTAHKKVCSA